MEMMFSICPPDVLARADQLQRSLKRCTSGSSRSPSGTRGVGQIQNLATDDFVVVSLCQVFHQVYKSVARLQYVK